MHGRAKDALLALSLLVAFPLGLRFVRRYLQRKKAVATV
jgi:hypothetical protein